MSRFPVAFLVSLAVPFLPIVECRGAQPAVRPPASRPQPDVGVGGVAIPVPPPGHPRVLLRSDDVQKLAQRLHDPAFRRFADRVTTISESGWDGTLPVAAQFDTKVSNWMEWGRGKLPPSPSQNYDPRLHEQIEFCALRFLLEKDERMGRRAVALLEKVLRTVTFPSKREAMDITRGKGATITTAAIVYDWCYPLLDAAQKRFIISQIRRIAATTEVGFPAKGDSAVVGHAGEANIFRDLTAAGMAVYDEDPEIYHTTTRRLFADMIPARDFFYGSRWHNQGSSYGHVRGKWELWCAALFARMSGQRVFSSDQAKLLYSTYYCTRPDGAEMADGDGPAIPLGWKEGKPSANVETCELLSVFLSHDPVIEGMLQKHLRERDELTDTLPYFLFAEPDLPTRPLETLPLSTYFDEPAGVMVARTGWHFGKSSPDVIVSMKIAPWMFANHQHLDAGQFQIWYRGMLAVESGAYSGKEGGYGSPHWLNYYQRSIAHNTVLVKDPAEKVAWGATPVENDGGQLWPNRGREPVSLPDLRANGYHVGQVLAHATGPNAADPAYSYLSGSIGSYGPKVENFTRSFLFLNLHQREHPAVLVVYDRVRSSSPAFEKQWLLHSIARPEVQRDGFSVDSQFGGRLDATVLLPRRTAYTANVVGGPGAEYLVNGTNYPMTQANGFRHEGAGWRVELTATTKARQDAFLVVLQVHDKQPAIAPLPVTELQAAGCVGFVVGDQVVLFPDHDGWIGSRLEVNLPSDRPVDLTVAGVVAGTWSVPGHEACAASADGHLIHFPGLSGRVVITRAEATAAAPAR